MFTGIVTDIGTVAARDGTTLKIASHYDPASIALGASDRLRRLLPHRHQRRGRRRRRHLRGERLQRDRLPHHPWALEEGTRVNLERSLSVGSELGGHLMTGHIDGLARIVERTPDGESARFVLEAPAEFAQFIAAKGSVALNGVSLTVNEVEGHRFGVNIIPYTLTHTTWGDRKPGDLVNLEVDLLARYVERIAAGRFAASRAIPEQDR